MRTRAGAAPHTVLHKNNFARAIGAHRHGYRAHQAFRPVVFVFQVRTFRIHKLHHEAKDHPRSAQSAEYRDSQSDETLQMRTRSQDVTDPTKPGQKRHRRRSVEPRNVTAGMCRAGLAHSAHRTSMASVRRAMKGHVHPERQMDVHRSSEKRKHAQRETYDETEKIEILPGHKTPPKKNTVTGARTCR